MPGRHALNLSMLLGNVGAMGYYMTSDSPTVGMSMLGITTALSSIMGVTLTAAIGGNLFIYILFTYLLFILFYYPLAFEERWGY